jgi:hypothetical protein
MHLYPLKGEYRRDGWVENSSHRVQVAYQDNVSAVDGLQEDTGITLHAARRRKGQKI